MFEFQQSSNDTSKCYTTKNFNRFLSKLGEKGQLNTEFTLLQLQPIKT